MSLSTEQHDAFRAIKQWLSDTQGQIFRGHDDEQWMFVLQGYAGTGKTYLLAHIIQELSGTKIHCAAPTGKAASVLMSKMQGVEVVTLHRLLYQPIDEDLFELRALMAQADTLRKKHAEGEAGLEAKIKELDAKIAAEQKKIAGKGPGFARKDESDIIPGDLVIVDEGSMVDARLRDDLKKTGCRALFVGDPGQLPPVGEDGWFVKQEPDAMLRTIQRQALESPIIRFSMQIREGMARPREWKQTPMCGIWKKEDVDPNLWLTYDQVITGTNASRHRVNRFFRKRLGYEGAIPNEGEKLICLKNDYDRSPQLINGTQFLSEGEAEIAADGENYVMPVNYEGRQFNAHFYPYHCLKHYYGDLHELPREFRRGLMELDFAYAITVHKSQGSEWGKVIVADDQMRINDTNFRRRWLYTAVTRAKEELMIIQ